MIQLIIHLIYLIVYFYVVTSTIYLLVLALAGKWASDSEFADAVLKKKIIVLIPAYKEDAIILETAKRAVVHNYPSSLFEVLIIADSLQVETIEKLKNVPVRVLEVKFELSTKARSLHAALETVDNDNFEIVVILDADNYMHPGCLDQINNAFNNNLKAVQCHRTAKNRDTPVAILDTISEEININLFRRGPAALGLSAMPLGSGMAFEFTLLKEIFDTDGILDNPAEDREIEIQLMKRDIKMKFLNSVYVYDEKVSDASVFQKQRTRWMEAQLNHITRLFKPDLKDRPKSAVYYNILFQSLFLPRLLYLVICGMITVMLIFQYLCNTFLVYPSPVYWICWILVYFFVLLISIPLNYYSLKTVRAIYYIPVLMISMLRAIFKLKRNRKEFLHTSKKYNEKS